MNITDAIEKLDPENEDHWTQDGLPRVDAVAKLTGDESLQRKDITSAAPQYDRSAAKRRHMAAEAAGQDPRADYSDTPIEEIPLNVLGASEDLLKKAIEAVKGQAAACQAEIDDKVTALRACNAKLSWLSARYGQVRQDPAKTAQDDRLAVVRAQAEAATKRAEARKAALSSSDPAVVARAAADEATKRGGIDQALAAANVASVQGAPVAVARPVAPKE